MLKAAIDTEIFKETVDVISAMVTECRLHINEDSFSTRAVDTANVAMISLDLSSSAFSSYEGTDTEIGLDINKMKNIVSMMGKEDTLSLDLPEGGYKMEMSFGGYKYSIALLDVNTVRKDPNPPNIELPGKVIISGTALNNAIKAAALVSDKIAFGINPEKGTFYMEADGDTDHINLELGTDELISLVPAEARSMFSLDYLKDMGKVMSKADEVEIQIGIDHPVKFVFNIADGNGHVEYLLAPRIEAD
ncbi:DNA polymerase sliding clamp [Methanoplanus sp. FWC-SCC4]|uniref:DNA polymerase sliding clamp n=1 Tax=Methanochimaera problematica TaxID=2609417 RepID=A0AA97FCY6_9EURY|nr:DNA polymerase sliding clamp [Methanoplanus sp. FWC-SCC4]WOF16247.1 DNA polymerase sliding clamp [Methanoplanus sp. FWC-SCC4]